jgi:hypothetical protein
MIVRRLAWWFTVPLCAVAVVAVVCCYPRDRLVREALSPDGSAVASAVDARGWRLDGPYQALYIRRSDDARRVAELAPDNESCLEIAWRGDSRQVAFVIRATGGVHLRLYDALTRDVLARVPLVGEGMEARNVEIARVGGRATFDECNPSTGTCVPREVRLAASSGGTD